MLFKTNSSTGINAEKSTNDFKKEYQWSIIANKVTSQGGRSETPTQIRSTLTCVLCVFLVAFPIAGGVWGGQTNKTKQNQKQTSDKTNSRDKELVMDHIHMILPTIKMALTKSIRLRQSLTDILRGELYSR